MHVHRAAFDIEVRAPDGIEQLLARKHAPRTLHQLIEQPVFSWAEMNVAVSPPYAMVGAIKTDLTDRYRIFDRLGRTRRITARNRARNSVMEKGLTM